MGIRETLNKNPAITGGAVVVVIAAAVLVIIRHSGKTELPNQVPDQAYYTTDEGATLITLSKDEVPPITLPDGKIALRAHVFSCDGGKTRQVLWLEKYSDAVVAKAAEARKTGEVEARMAVSMATPQVKKPGAGNKWVSSNSAEAEAMGQAPPCPNGGTAREIFPGQ